METLQIQHHHRRLSFKYEGKLKSFFIEKQHLDELDNLLLGKEVTGALMVAQGTNKKLELFEHKIRIRTDGILPGYGMKDKEILINQITSINFKKDGYIHFDFPGAKNPRVFHTKFGPKFEDDENTIIFDPKKSKDFEKIKERIESKMMEFHSSKSDNELDDLEKLAELKEKRIITEEEFQAKKKQILKI